MNTQAIQAPGTKGCSMTEDSVVEPEQRTGRGRPTGRRWLALYLVCAAQLMIVLDGTIVNVALPAIRGSLGFSETGLSWVVNAYLLTFGGFLLLGGRAGDLFGRRRGFASGSRSLRSPRSCAGSQGARGCSWSLAPCRGWAGLSSPRQPSP